MGILSLIIGKAMNYTEQILTGTAGFIMATAAGIVGWWVKRGMASSDGKAKTTRVKHTEPCDAHIKFEKAMEKTIDELKESIRAIDHRLENSDLVQLQIMKQQMEMMKAIGDIKESVAFMATERGMKKSDIKDESRKSALLFVDDRIDLMEALVIKIELMGFVVQKATSYEDGKESFLSQPFDFCIIDAELERGTMDGKQLAKWISENFRSVHVFLFSGHQLDSIPPRVTFYEKGDHEKMLSDLQSRKKHDDAQRITA